VVASKRDESRAARAEFGRSVLDLVHRLEDVERVRRDVSSIRDLLRGERFDILRRIVWTEKAGCLTDVRRSESRAWTVADPGVERYANDGDIRVRDIAQLRKPGKSCDARISGIEACVGWSDGDI
jgi:hypothetical protein